jgi:hypothetical protein
MPLGLYWGYTVRGGENVVAPLRLLLCEVAFATKHEPRTTAPMPSIGLAGLRPAKSSKDF